MEYAVPRYHVLLLSVPSKCTIGQWDGNGMYSHAVIHFTTVCPIQMYHWDMRMEMGYIFCYRCLSYQKVDDHFTLSHLDWMYLWKQIFLSISFYESYKSKIVGQHPFLQVCSYLLIPKLIEGGASSVCRFCFCVYTNLYRGLRTSGHRWSNISSILARIKNFRSAPCSWMDELSTGTRVVAISHSVSLLI